MLEYDNTIDDIVALQLYYFGNSPKVKSKLRLQFLIIVVALGVAIIVGTGSWRDAVVPVTASTVLGCLILQSKGLSLVARSTEKTVRKNLAQHSTSTHYRLALDEETLNEECHVGTHAIRYKALGDIKETPSHIFIYVNPLSYGLVVIPKRGQDSLALENFLRELRGRMAPKQDAATGIPDES